MISSAALHLFTSSPAARFVVVAAISAFLAWMSRIEFAYARPFGISDAESLMNFSQFGSLQCHCEPTNPAEPCNDRRQSCRACGNSIVSNDAARLYQRLSKQEIRLMTRTLQHAAIDARTSELPASLVSLAELHACLGPRVADFRS